ncbi:adenylate/guanylate cyclase domain-containing protein [Endozoicomonas sp. SM1973]|uniref:Adenylate/guanylate cyclase domain-containing protein n=1 Tax=Spartinivicinus marinus TaxID=2994442 RepID=A0A853IA57_9GAMM|nr:adenylate/guanylate cyclase domain-containing protein [Spartinivicinus marinus]MCX4029792.1 adenylate/guanylate cyclase domain-containing protein [Spartinivicinus marinus]NYZ67538.1 adenylate/guanylate cyclase domain-containing protein [Spartinivicinus marinus]
MVWKKLTTWLSFSHLALPTSKLPDRFQQAVQRQQTIGEQLIAGIEFVIVVLFWLLYSLSPKTFSKNTDDLVSPIWSYEGLLHMVQAEPVPWALSAYLGFAISRLWLVYYRPKDNWHAYLSIIMDFALLYALIWCFHIQYQQPPSFYLKAPTLLYVFIFIAIRSLRFEARFVIMAGLVAVIGWLMMVAYVVFSQPGMPMITRDYVAYLTSNSVLLGAEFDKMITMVFVTLILALAITRARFLLIEAVVESQAVEDLARFVPTSVAKNITQSEQRVAAGFGEVREATMLFTDIAGFTSLSEELSPETLIQVLNHYFSVVAEPIEAFGGTINQFQGDAILATFNLPTADDDHARHAIEAALAIQQALAKEQIELTTRIGINTGLVVGGLVGTKDRLTYTVHGDAVNLAARLEALNKQYNTLILLSERTRALAKGAFDFRLVGEVQVRGRTQPTSIYTLRE